MPSCTTFDISAEYSVEICSASKWTSCSKPITLAIEADPLVHVAQFDVADDVVHDADADALALDRPRLEAGHERAVVVALDQAVDRVAIGGDGGALDRAVVVVEHLRLQQRLAPAAERHMIGLLDVGHAQGDVLHAVAVAVDLFGHLARAAQGGGEHQAHAALLQHIGHAVALAGLGAAIADDVIAPDQAIIVGGLQRVADIEFEVVDGLNGEEVFLGGALLIALRKLTRGTVSTMLLLLEMHHICG